MTKPSTSSVTPRGRSNKPTAPNRRPIAARESGWARSLAASLASGGVSPNAISIASMVFAALGAWGMLMAAPFGYLVAVLSVQLRLVCNLLDGMVAIEGGRKSPVGDLYNEVPDRVADSLLLVALGYASGDLWVGWAAALFAALTAYMRVLGGALRQQQSFRGPMAKQHRMAVLTGGLLLAFALQFVHPAKLNTLPPGALPHAALFLTGLIIVVGSAITCVLRLQGVARRLRRQAEKDAVNVREETARDDR